MANAFARFDDRINVLYRESVHRFQIIPDIDLVDVPRELTYKRVGTLPALRSQKSASDRR